MNMHTYQYYILFLLSSGLKKCDCHRRWICHLGVPHLWIPIPKSNMVQGRLPNRKFHWFPDNLPEWNCSSYDSWSFCRRQWTIYLQCCEWGWDCQHVLLSSCAGLVATLPPSFHTCHHSHPSLSADTSFHNMTFVHLVMVSPFGMGVRLWGQFNCQC